MGSNQSAPYFNTEKSQKIEDELSQLQAGQIQRDSLQYTLLLMCGRFIIDLDTFYQKTDAKVMAQFIHDLGSMKEKEAVRIVKMIIKNSNTNEEAQEKIKRVLSKMRVATQDQKQIIHISPIHCPILYAKIVKPYKAPWGKNYVPERIDFDSKKTKSKKEKLMSKEVNDVIHTRHAASVILENPVHNLYSREVTFTPFELTKKPSKPLFWTKNIHQAAFKGDVSSVSFCLSLLPSLLNCPDEKGNAPAHCAAEGGKPKVILFLNELGADLQQANDEGFLPLHLAGNKQVVFALQSIGCDLNCRNAAGESLLEIKTKNFDKKSLKQF